MHGMHDMQERQPVDSDRASGLLTADQVQALLDIDRSTVYRMASDGRLPAVKIGRQWRFPADRIRHLLEVGLPADTAAARIAAPRTEAAPPTALAAEILEPVLDVAAEVLGVMMVVTDMAGQPVSHIANPAPRDGRGGRGPRGDRRLRRRVAGHGRRRRLRASLPPRAAVVRVRPRLHPQRPHPGRDGARRRDRAGRLAPAPTCTTSRPSSGARCWHRCPRWRPPLSRAATRAADPGRATVAVPPDRRSAR